MRLRRKPWIDEAVKEYESFVCLDAKEEMKGRWRSLFADPAAPLWVEIGTGKGNFIAQMAQLHGDVNFIGIEVQLGVLYYAAKKCAAAETENVRLLRFDATALESIFAAQEIDRIFINFCDPWPKKRHAKRRLTYRLFSTVTADCFGPAAAFVLSRTIAVFLILRWKNLRHGAGLCPK